MLARKSGLVFWAYTRPNATLRKTITAYRKLLFMCPPNKESLMAKFVLGLLVLLAFDAPVFSAPVTKFQKKLHKKCIYPTVLLADNTRSCGGSGFIVRSTKVGKTFQNVVVTLRRASPAASAMLS
jgi:hypothetical protein